MMSQQLATAQEAWGEALPDWVVTLAKQCAITSQNKVARRLGYSSTLVSLVLRRKYNGDLDAVETAVRGAFENLSLQCPAMGEISVLECRHWQQRSETFSNENSQRVRMFRACNSCPKKRKA